MIYDEHVIGKWSPFIKNYYESLGYEYTSMGSEFKIKINDLQQRSTIKVKVKCDNTSCKNTWEINYNYYTKGKEKAINKNDYCKECFNLKVKDYKDTQKAKAFKRVREICEEKGYELIIGFDEYTGSNDRCIKYKCPNHLEKGVQTTSLDTLRKGGGCVYCSIDSNSQKQRLDYEFVKGEFEKRGYELIENSYINSGTKMMYRCPNHPDEQLFISYDSLKQGKGCYLCGIERNRGNGGNNWKGGITSLNNYLRDKLSQWKRDSVKECNYRCVLTDGKFDVIHHLYSFHKILEETINETKLPIHPKVSDYTKEELKTLEDKCLEIHYRYPLGICLTKEVHKKFHSIYGKENNIPEQFEEFKTKYFILT